MSDIPVTQPSAPPSSPAPSNEAVIDPSPVRSPSPLGPQTPSISEGARRDTIKAAFERALNPPAKTARPAERPAAKPAEAKPGHNNPPEETPTLDLKKRPADQPRGERGRFAPRQQEPSEVEAAPQRPQQQQPSGQQQPRQHPYQALPEGTPYRDPPPRMAEHAKSEWHTAPESVRGEVHRMHQEFGRAYQYYKADNDTMNTIRPFHQMATQHGTSLQRALTNYVGMEQKLRADPIGGLDTIVRNLNLQTPDGQHIGLRDIAYYILNQSPEQLKMVQQGNAQQAAQHQIGSLHQEVLGLKNTLQQMHNQQQFGYARSAVDQFAETHPRFDELSAIIDNELKFGFDLETAYRRAELLYPTTHAAQTRNPPAQTRTVDRSIYGAPDVSPSNGASRKPKEASRSPREAVVRAMRVNGGL